MKMKKSYIKNIIKEEIESYMDELISKTGLELTEAPQVSGINTDDNEELMKILGRQIANVPENDKENLLTTLINAVNNYVKRVAPGLPIQEAYLQTAIDEAFEGVVLNEVSKEQIKRAIAKVLMAAGVAATMAGSGADAAIKHVEEPQAVTTQLSSGETVELKKIPNKFLKIVLTNEPNYENLSDDDKVKYDRYVSRKASDILMDMNQEMFYSKLYLYDRAMGKTNFQKFLTRTSNNAAIDMKKVIDKYDLDSLNLTWDQIGDWAPPGYQDAEDDQTKKFQKAYPQIKENHPGSDQYVPADPLYKKYKNIERTYSPEAALKSLHQDMKMSGLQDLVDDWADTPDYEWREMLDTIIYYSNSKMGTEKLDDLIKVGLS